MFACFFRCFGSGFGLFSGRAAQAHFGRSTSKPLTVYFPTKTDEAFHQLNLVGGEITIWVGGMGKINNAPFKYLRKELKFVVKLIETLIETFIEVS